MTQPETHPRSAPIALWRAARAFLEILFHTFGGPKDIAGEHVFSAKAYALICAWLRAGEAILRQLLLIEAAALPQPEAPPELPEEAPANTRRCTPRKARPCLLDKPEEWTVSFRCFASCSPGGGCARWRENKSKSAQRLHPAFPIAARMEALLRVFNDPIPYAQRLSRRLRKRPRRAADLLREPPPPRIAAAPRDCAKIDGLMAAAYVAWAKLDTS